MVCQGKVLGHIVCINSISIDEEKDDLSSPWAMATRVTNHRPCGQRFKPSGKYKMSFLSQHEDIRGIQSASESHPSVSENAKLGRREKACRSCLPLLSPSSVYHSAGHDTDTRLASLDANRSPCHVLCPRIYSGAVSSSSTFSTPGTYRRTTTTAGTTNSSETLRCPTKRPPVLSLSKKKDTAVFPSSIPLPY